MIIESLIISATFETDLTVSSPNHPEAKGGEIDVEKGDRIPGVPHHNLKADITFDETYETFGLFGEADEVLGDDFEDSRFLSPGAPRAAWIGLEAIF